MDEQWMVEALLTGLSARERRRLLRLIATGRRQLVREPVCPSTSATVLRLPVQRNPDPDPDRLLRDVTVPCGCGALLPLAGLLAAGEAVCTRCGDPLSVPTGS